MNLLPLSTATPPALNTAWRAATACAVLLLLAACKGQPDAGAASGAAPAGASGAGVATAASGAAAGASGASGPSAPPAPPVSITTATAKQRDMDVQVELTGTVVPLASVDVKPQVSAIVQKVHVREGQSVKAGEVLFTLDTRSDEANVARLRAQMARDEAALADARRQLKRSEELIAQGFISQGAADTNRTLVETQLAVVAADKAALDAARIPVGQGRISAPNSGRVGTITIYPGSVVKANETTLLSITQLDPADVAFALPQRYLGEALAALKAGGGTAVTASLPERNDKLRGKLQFIDNAVDAGSGTIKVKARFANPQSLLWPGAFVKLAMTVRTIKDAVVVPQAAIFQSPRGPVVYLVAGGKAVPKVLEVLASQGDDAAVTGLKPGDRVVLDGRQNLRPGAAVVERSRPPGGKASGGKPDGAASSPAGGGASGAAGAASGSRAAAAPALAPASAPASADAGMNSGPSAAARPASGAASGQRKP